MVTGHCWKVLSHAARKCRVPAYVAVAYVGPNGARQLHLRRGSRLVVDASEHAVKSSQTSPMELLRWLRRGVEVFTRSSLHAKVYVFGREVYVGSANVSERSFGQLCEALIKTRERSAVADAREFVQSLCLDRLTEATLKRLSKIYRPPKGFRNAGPRNRSLRRGRIMPDLVRAKVVQLVPDTTRYSQRDERWDDEQRHEAKTSRWHLRGNDINRIVWEGACPLDVGDKVIQCMKESNGRSYISPPATVLRIRRHAAEDKQAWWIYLTIPPDRRRQDARRVAKMLGRRGSRLLRTQGVVRPYSDGLQLLKVLER